MWSARRKLSSMHAAAQRSPEVPARAGPVHQLSCHKFTEVSHERASCASLTSKKGEATVVSQAHVQTAQDALLSPGGFVHSIRQRDDSQTVTDLGRLAL